ncbi:sigma-54-dependent Fis family transcriptional regulator [bacterium]|nr:sigma-54-dependent Fis family transcriptional regulator [bacterium]
MKTILIVDDEPDILWTLSNVLKEKGYFPITAQNGKEGLKKLEEEQPDLAVLDIRLPDMNGIELLKQMKKKEQDLSIIMFTAYGEINSAVEAIKLGAFDYLNKPVANEELLLVIERAFKSKNLNEEVKFLRQCLHEKIETKNILGKSQVMKNVFSQIDQVSPTDLTVILQGESGTGKEVVAHLIHQKSLRKNRPFIIVDCSTIPESLVESELFGYEKGAFTGADRRKLGYFELANEGTIFLDEIGNLPSSTQAKMLRVLEERTIQHLGGKKVIKINVRIIVATNFPLEEAVRKGCFREDLYHRLNQFTVFLPPLHKRKEDIIPLAQYFLKEANTELHKQINCFSPEVLKLLGQYSWSGNIREMKNVIKRAVLLADETIFPRHLPERFQVLSSASEEFISRDKGIIISESLNLKQAIEQLEKKVIKKVLQEVSGNKLKAAKVLGIDRKSLYNKMKKFGFKM